MSEPSLTVLVDVLSASSPYGMLAATLWAFWRINERKDNQMRQMHERIVDLAQKQTQALTRVESALLALRDAISGLGR